MKPVIADWVNYYRYCAASDTFRKADYLIFEKLWQWAGREHPKKGKYWMQTGISQELKTETGALQQLKEGR
jgi:RNA-directed DNA polymerase